ncbi:2Fe-2S iron-sulfur cluster-binding protein [Methylocystis parvus]|uniref:2Fe-2S iron-sulfur cluster-binding protein n=1 Tax=Methylocystis parvus TaxID=134 RepID=UPI001FCB7DC9|nr:2Fe-2S iron-sulfur cluster binding domain-containing protein [Methylocystis parvus]WBK02159.1 2Fe-2S iron-sulfur cluster binding domain-containing protein [Methylocystis parvus OBBP]
MFRRLPFGEGKSRAPAGGCATCKGECTDGDYELFDVKVQALPPEEEEAGMVLLCRAFPRSDLHTCRLHLRPDFFRGDPDKLARRDQVLRQGLVERRVARRADAHRRRRTDRRPWRYEAEALFPQLRLARESGAVS